MANNSRIEDEHCSLRTLYDTNVVRVK